MTKLLEFPKSKTEVTWIEAMQLMMDNAAEAVKNKPVINLLVISEDKSDYAFGILKDDEIRSMIGTMECVKNYFTAVISDYDHDE